MYLLTIIKRDILNAQAALVIRGVLFSKLPENTKTEDTKGAH